MNTNTYYGGTLSSIASKRSKPSASAALIRADPRDIACLPLNCFVLDDRGTPPTLGIFNKILCYHMARFYTSSQIDESDSLDLLVASVGLIANFANFRVLAPWQSMVTALRSAQIEVTFRRVDYAGVETLYHNDPKCLAFQDVFGQDCHRIVHSTYGPIVLSSILLLSMAKNITEDNFVGWFRNRVRGFSGTVGQSFLQADLSESTYPAISCVSKYHSICSASFLVRKESFLTILSIGSGTTRNFIYNCCNEIINLMRATEMNHLVLIDKYILGKYPELRGLSFMKGLDAIFSEAANFLTNYDSKTVMFVRLLHDKDETAVLNRNRFETYATVATAVAQFENSTYDQYFISETESHQRIAKLIKRYLHHRANLTVVASGDHVREMGEHEKTAFFAKALAEFEAEYLKVDKETSDDQSIMSLKAFDQIQWPK